MSVRRIGPPDRTYAGQAESQAGARPKPRTGSDRFDASGEERARLPIRSPRGFLDTLFSALRPPNRAVTGVLLGASLFAGRASGQSAPAPIEPPRAEASGAAVQPPEQEVASGLAAAGALATALDQAGHKETAKALRVEIARHGPEGEVDGVLSTALSAVRGDPIMPSDTTDASRRWRLGVRLGSGNDNLATLFDGRYRSDDGATASLFSEVVATRETDEGREQLIGEARMDMLTERGGMRRTDLVDALFTYSRAQDPGVLWVDDLAWSVTAGVEGTGNFGGAGLQDAWHALGEGTALAGRRLGEGLQDEYTGDREYALILGAGATATRDLGPVELSLSADARAPIGGTGRGYAGAGAGLRLGQETGPFIEGGIEHGYQWTNGGALDFDGAPISDDWVTRPRLGIGWQGDSWSLVLGWERNRLGTMEGMGDLDADHVGITFTLGGGRRIR